MKNKDYYNININKNILKKFLKAIALSLFLLIFYSLWPYIISCFFLVPVDFFYTPAERYALAHVLKYSFGLMEDECLNYNFFNEEQKKFFNKVQIFDPAKHDFSYIFNKKAEKCLFITGDEADEVIPLIPIYKDLDTIKVLISSKDIIKDSYVLPKLLDIAKNPCLYIPPKSELLNIQKEIGTDPTNGRNSEHNLSFIVEQYVEARELLKCDTNFPKNDKVELVFYERIDKYEKMNRAITIKLRRQGN